MNSLPILFMSKEAEGREHIAERTLESLYSKLGHTPDTIIYLCVSGSSMYLNKILSIAEKLFQRVYYQVFTDVSAGIAWNRVIKFIFENHDYYLRMEDDFLLKDYLNINSYIELLETNQSVGMVRLGLMPIKLKLYSVGWYDSMNQGHIFLDCLPTTAYAYSGNPGLVHKRLHDAVGYFHEEHNPGDIEIDFDSRVRKKMVEGGPRIWWPLDLGAYGTYGAWQHIGEVKSY